MYTKAYESVISSYTLSFQTLSMVFTAKGKKDSDLFHFVEKALKEFPPLFFLRKLISPFLIVFC